VNNRVAPGDRCAERPMIAKAPASEIDSEAADPARPAQGADKRPDLAAFSD
jgi:hypothetical protein